MIAAACGGGPDDGGPDEPTTSSLQPTTTTESKSVSPTTAIDGASDVGGSPPTANEIVAISCEDTYLDNEDYTLEVEYSIMTLTAIDPVAQSDRDLLNVKVPRCYSEGSHFSADGQYLYLPGAKNLVLVRMEDGSSFLFDDEFLQALSIKLAGDGIDAFRPEFEDVVFDSFRNRLSLTFEGPDLGDSFEGHHYYYFDADQLFGSPSSLPKGPFGGIPCTITTQSVCIRNGDFMGVGQGIFGPLPDIPIGTDPPEEVKIRPECDMDIQSSVFVDEDHVISGTTPGLGVADYQIELSTLSQQNCSVLFSSTGTRPMSVIGKPGASSFFVLTPPLEGSGYEVYRASLDDPEPELVGSVGNLNFVGWIWPFSPYGG